MLYLFPLIMLMIINTSITVNGMLISCVSFITGTIKPYTKPFLKKHPKMTYYLLALFIALSVYAVSGKFSNRFMLTFFIVSVFRYFRLIVNIIAFAHLRGHPIKSKPSFKSTDVSVVVPTVFANANEVIECLQRITVCKPKQIIIVTRNDIVPNVLAACADATAAAERNGREAEKLDNIQVVGVDKLNKRTQMVAALQQAVTGSIVAFADDDVFWPNSNFINTMLACFEDPLVGACGPSQRVVRTTEKNEHTSLFNFLGICYLERRNFNTGATNLIDGAVSTLSGRTSFYRASLIQTASFYDFFLNAANHDDDKNLTRWVYDQGFQITLQFDPSARISTTLETAPMMFLKQCMRWSRGHWRGNFRVMQTTTYWYDTHIWSLYAIYIGQFQTPAVLFDGGLLTLLHLALSSCTSFTYTASMIALVSWILFTKIVKIIPHFREFPQDIRFIPAMICFSYFHGFLNVYCLATRNQTAWGR